MTKIHITLIGGQPIPVYTGFVYDNQLKEIDKLVFVVSQETQRESERLKAQIESCPIETRICAPTQVDEIRKLAEELFERHQDCQITLNLTSGTKFWSLIFYDTFRHHPHASFLIVEQNNTVHNLITREKTVIPIERDLKFALHGAHMMKYTRLSEFTEDDLKVAQKIAGVRAYNFQAFKNLTMDKSKVSPGMTLKDGSSIDWNEDEGWLELTLYGTYGEKTYTFESEHVVAVVFNNAWFELLVAQELQRNSRVKEVLMNCTFMAGNITAKNEIDIILDMGDKLFFVECKTQISDITAIDKFRSALKNFSGLSSKGIFVVHDFSQAKETITKEKCTDNNILYFCWRNWFKDRLNNPSLNEVINQEVDRNNTR